MNRRSLILLAFLFLVTIGLKAQTIKPYIAIVKTNYGKEKGILRQVLNDVLILEQGDSLKTIKATDIKNIRIRVTKKPYSIITPLKYEPMGENEYTKDIQGNKVRKDGKQDPPLEEQIAGHVFFTMANVAVNMFAAPIHAINPSINEIKINQDLKKYAEFRYELTLYSIYYQYNPDDQGELAKMKAISKGFKP
ncbi:hypothetical protein [Pedobacter nototheniae]|uniref:hypothetical protein n=1 Tax=Pedobacter nototheniae TaxID=2488994 RepID=UPI00292FE7A1|nr:hypothetical protein [Pedobacter nototheniae]